MTHTPAARGRLIRKSIAHGGVSLGSLAVLAPALVATAVLTGVAVAAGGSTASPAAAASSTSAPPKPVTLVPERAVGPIHLGDKRSAIEDRFGEGEAHGDWVSVYHYRKVALVVAYTEQNRVREVSGSGGRLVAYSQRLSNEAAATKVLKDQGWTIKQCSTKLRIAQHARNKRFSGVVWNNHKLVQVGVSAIGSIGGCLIGSPGNPNP
jgi:hypothetical protein